MPRSTRLIQLCLNVALVTTLFVGLVTARHLEHLSAPTSDRAAVEHQLRDLERRLADDLTPGSAAYREAYERGRRVITHVRAGTLVFFHPGNPVAESIRYFSTSPRQRPAPGHTFIGIAPGLTADAAFSGVTVTRAVDIFLADPALLELREVPGITDAQRRRAARFAIDQVGKPYNLSGLFFGLRGGQRSWYCSELSLQALRAAGVDVQPDRDLTLQTLISPYALLPSPLTAATALLPPVMDLIQVSPQELRYARVAGRRLETTFTTSDDPVQPSSLTALPAVLTFSFASVSTVIHALKTIRKGARDMRKTSREHLLEEVRSRLDRGQDVLVLGGRGMGKSWALGTVAQAHGHAIILPQTNSKKAILLKVCRRLWRDGELEEFALYVDWEDVRTKLRRRTVDELTTLAQSFLSDRYLIVADDLEKYTEKTIRNLIRPMMDVSPTLAASNYEDATKSRRERVDLVADRCHRVEIPPLDRGEVRAMLWGLLDRDDYPHWQVIETKVFNESNRCPGAVADLTARLRGSGGSLREVRQLSHAGARRRVNLLLPVGIGLIALVLAGRYVARGLDDPTLYVLAGLGSAASYALRPLLWRS